MRYLKEEMVHDCVREKDIIVFDTNIQLIMDIDRVAKRIKHEFPEVLRILKLKAINNLLFPGDAIVVKVRGFTIVALITQCELFGSNKDDIETINMFTMNAISNMLKQLSPTLHYTSGILNRSQSKWERIAYHISNKKLNWSIYTE